MDEIKKYGQMANILEKGHRFEFEDGYIYTLEEVDYSGEYDFETLREAIGDLQDEVCDTADEIEYIKFCHSDEFLTLNSISLSAENEENNVNMDGIAMFVGDYTSIKPFGQHIKRPYGIFIPYYNFSNAEVIFDAESNKLSDLDKKDLIEASKGIKDAIKKLPYKNLQDLMQMYTNKEFSESEVGITSANEMSENTEKKEEAYSKVNIKVNERNQEKNIDIQE